ncbi:hypothetical protein [Shewanella waksmanii]|uniref:hypothetical protein n=1 Tax=Shewanella waksmanii TaxID=213783 RepID=UPI00048C8A48|nr:hypothetical protein [Shewanella waksmanii]
MKSDTEGVSVLLMFAFALLGGGFVVLVESELLATQLVIASVFIANISAIYSKKLQCIKDKIRNLTASFLFGALIGVIIV